jgi:serine protease inhibitor
MNYADKKDHGEVKDLEMAEQQLRNIHANAVDLLRHLEKHPHCPLLSQAWVQSKVTLSNAYVDSVRDYVVNSQKELESMEEDDGVYDSEDGPMGFLIAVEKGASKY